MLSLEIPVQNVYQFLFSLQVTDIKENIAKPELLTSFHHCSGSITEQ